ncbi:MAG: NADH-quinone oxidoreductase subunit L [Anaerolineae bacterium]|nr:NADH-quinone oxidoreductase subunit L [Anaerolineae bacterium]
MLNYAWLIFVPPLLALLINVFLGRRLGRTVSGWLGALAVGLSFLVAVALYFGLHSLPAEERQVTVTLWSWITIGSFQPQIALLIDPLSVLMALVVTGVGFLIHVYSVEYMKQDDEHHDMDVRRYVRYFVFVNFFIVAMLILVLANNFVMLYMGWEGVGLASFLLISFWYYKPSARDAGKKAFLVNRIGDFGMALAIFMIFLTVGSVAGSLAFKDVFAAAAANPALIVGSIGAITLLMLLAATGKSAQIPLWVWLPDAMEGPTPVSALIHAATMVTAGVYLIVRTSPLFEMAGNVLTVVAWVGGLTALMGATIALTKTDLKRILAYSTISQIGYMFLAVGSSAYVAGMFHLTTHALFKACLFLGAGSVMHALHGELDINKMGGLKDKMRSTYWTFLIAAATLAGFPLVTGGFWSKDAILIGTFQDGQWLLYAIGLFGALLTAIYSFKMVFVVFWGKPRDQKLYDHAHESPRLMTWPLWILAVLSIVVSYLFLPEFLPVVGGLLGGWLETAVAHGTEVAHLTIPIEVVLLVASTIVSLTGTYLAYRWYVQKPESVASLRERLNFFHKLADNGYYFDFAYDHLRQWLWAAARWLAGTFDAGIIDRAVNGIAKGTGVVGAWTARLQTGLVGVYALTLFVGLVVVLGYFLITALLK